MLPLFLALTSTTLFSPVPQTALAASPDPAGWSGDVRFLVAAVDSIHPRPYRHCGRAAWDSAAADLERRLPAMRHDQAVAGFSRLLGLLADGHSRLDQLRLPSHGRPMLLPLPGPGFERTYPLEFEVFSDGLRIVSTPAAHASLLGGRVVSIGSTPVAQAVTAISPLIPADNPMWVLRALPAFLRSPGYLCAAGLIRHPSDPLELTFVDERGKSRQARLSAEQADSTVRWLTADREVSRPLPLTRALSLPFEFTGLDDSTRTVFARIRSITNAAGGATFADHVARMFARVDSVASRRLILDLRGNGGGDNYLNQPLVHGILMRPSLNRPGGLFVIVDRGTFSAAVSLAADLQRETRALFVGEPTGAAPNSPGDPARVRLPASGLVVRISTVLWSGSDPRDPRKFIAPDIAAMASWSDWIEHRDPAMAAIESFVPPPDAELAPPNTRWGSRAQLQARVPGIAW